MDRMIVFVPLLLLLWGCGKCGTTTFQIDEQIFRPQSYICQRATREIVIDGRGDDIDWRNAQWTSYFIDIEGDAKPDPLYKTRVKMLWDDSYLYFLAEMEEPHIRATLTERDAVIFHDNDFEIFIDPTGDTHHYLEYEVNAYGTIWDLMITRPYRDHGMIFDHWDINGIRQAIGINGTINKPYDLDQSWIVEVAIPMDVLREANYNRIAKAGDIWRLNFSRVQWHVDIVEGQYLKKKDSEGKLLPEENWVWSPQGVIAMHEPESWGFLKFSNLPAGEHDDAFVMPQDEMVKWALRHIYYQQRQWMVKNVNPGSLNELGMSKIKIGSFMFTPQLTIIGDGYQARIRSVENDGWWNIRRDGKVWKEQD